MAVLTRPKRKTTEIHIKMSPAEKENLDKATIRANVSRSEFIRNAIAHYLAT